MWKFWRQTAERFWRWVECEMALANKWDAELYDDKHSFVWKMAEDLLGLLGAKPGEKILDIGCGTGHMTAKIAESGALVTGLDRSPEMIQQAQAAYPGIRFEVGDAMMIPLDGPFDAVFSNATLHWIKEPERTVAEISRLLKPGGRFVAEFGGRGNVAELVAAMERAWAKLHLPQGLPNPWYFPSVGEYAAILERNGLEVTYSLLFDRPTPLEEGENGLRNFLIMFGGAIFVRLTDGEREEVIRETENEARAKLSHGSQWVLDYRRLRVVAKKQQGTSSAQLVIR
jgi:trans-aconitate 2-methyltransferase